MDATTCSILRSAQLAFAGVLAVTSSAGCRQVLGVDEFHALAVDSDSGTGNVVTPATVEFRAPRCTACMKDRCDSELSACMADPTCRDFWTCRARCGPDDGRCENTCRSRAWPWNGGAYRTDRTGELESCLASHCDGTCDVTHVLGTADCVACAHEECADVDWKAHAANVDVQHLETCDARCVAITQGDERRLEFCQCARETGASDDAVTLWNARRTCINKTCAARCNVPDLDCLGTGTVLPAVQEPLAYRLVAYGQQSEQAVHTSDARACSVTEPDCKIPRAGPDPLTFLPEMHPTTGNDGGDFAGSAEFTIPFGSSFEPFADHMEVHIGSYRNLLYQVPRLQQDRLTVWYPVSSLDHLVQLLGNIKPGFTAANQSVLAAIVSDCEGRALPGVKMSAEYSAKDGTDKRTLDATYVNSDADKGTAPDLAVVFFTDVPPGTVKVTATYDGQFHSSGQVLVVADGYTLIGLGPSAPGASGSP